MLQFESIVMVINNNKIEELTKYHNVKYSD